ncbi:hypothetical protein AaE_007877 [Aphanomyces astaci]|uniref:Uncharacterized protein n=1 Tax=Aphanomyces astaci TaxID=112090 RepID=A0A6A5A1G7_APHAT|nr:hypothetical protein AaE_007877 [Aphanomyces astaci]
MSDQAVIQVDQVVSVGNLTAEVKSTDVPLGTWMTGERLEMALGDSPPSILHFEFNRVRQSWHYGWRSNRFNCNIKHAFVVYVFEHHQGALRCLSRVMSPPFTICSTRRSGVVKPPLSPEPLGGGESDDDVKAEASPQRKRTRTTKSSTATSSSTDDDAVFLLPNHNEDDELMHTAVQEMLQLAEMQWECSVYAPWTAFRLDQLPQSHPHQLVGPCGLPTLGSGLHLCGTRAWEENQGIHPRDTLVVEWYFWPSQEDLPRKRVRERFTLLASTINSMMCQQFVELCWDNIHDIVVGPDVAQRVLLPANWQVHHIETYYYHRILAEF